MKSPDHKLYIIVEDDGFKLFLDRSLHITFLSEDSVQIVAGGGWTNLFNRYKGLLDSGIDPSIIIPIIDADTLGEANPRENREVLANPNLIRLHRDLEFSFDNWMIAEALIDLNSSPFTNDRDPLNFSKCFRLVNVARQVSIKEDIQFYRALNETFKDEYAAVGKGDRSACVLPSKVELAKAVAEIVARNRIFPEELARVAAQIEEIAVINDTGIRKDEKFGFGKFSPEIRKENRLEGKVLVSLGGKLWIIDFNLLQIYAFNDDTSWHINKSCWSHDGRFVASEAYKNNKRTRGVIIFGEDGTEKEFLTRNVTYGSESEPCWFSDDKSVLIKTEKGLCRKFIGSYDWPLVLGTETGTTSSQCVSLHGRIAINRYDKATGNYFLHIGARDAREPYDKVAGLTDTRAGVAWSSDGQHVAFVNHIDSERGAVCIYDNRSKKVEYITSHDGFPNYLCFSPENKFIIYTWRRAKDGYRELRLVDVSSRRIVVLFHEIPDMIIGCHAWKS